MHPIEVGTDVPEYVNILTEIMGKSSYLKVLGFFFEHPFRTYTIEYLSNRLSISRDKVREIVRFYQDKGYLLREASRGPYRLNTKDPMVAAIERSVEIMGDIVHREWNNMPFETPISAMAKTVRRAGNKFSKGMLNFDSNSLATEVSAA